MSRLPVEIGVLHGLCEGLEKAQDIETSLDVLQGTLHILGWQKLVYGWKSVETPDCMLHVPVMTRDFPANWDRNWAGHSANDPYFHRAYATKRPVFWSSVRKNEDTMNSKQLDCLHYIDDLGLVDGLTVPVCVYGRRFAFVTALDFNGAGKCCSEDDFAEQAELLKLIAHFFDNHMLGIAASAKGSGITLSPRERECLLWSAQGKTVDDVASIVGISAETTRVYIKRCITKMNASNKTHAVAKAIHLGMVSLN
jgi:DNA-binding CsgD family transcriptional regulator